MSHELFFLEKWSSLVCNCCTVVCVEVEFSGKSLNVETLYPSFSPGLGTTKTENLNFITMGSESGKGTFATKKPTQPRVDLGATLGNYTLMLRKKTRNHVVIKSMGSGTDSSRSNPSSILLASILESVSRFLL